MQTTQFTAANNNPSLDNILPINLLAVMIRQIKQRSLMSHKLNSEIMGQVGIFRKNKMKNVHLLKISLLMLMMQAYCKRIYMESSEHNGAYISPPICINRLIFSGCLPRYANLCHNLTNLVFVMPSLCFSIHLHKPKEIIKGQKMVTFAVLCPSSTFIFFLFVISLFLAQNYDQYDYLIYLF